MTKMKKSKSILVTGAAGFVGKNLVSALQRIDSINLTTIDSTDSRLILDNALLTADIIYHLAGVNRSKNDSDFEKGNTGLTKYITNFLLDKERAPRIILSSSIQAVLDNPYGRSKKKSEENLLEYQQKSGAVVALYRLPGVFGKWSRPNYNTVVATFCNNVIRGLDIIISNPEHELELVYIDDVVAEFLSHLDDAFTNTTQWCTVNRTFRVTLGGLARRVRDLHAIRETLVIPDLSDDFMKYLYATYLSFLPEDCFSYPVNMFTDDRGWLFELFKSTNFGQIFVSKTFPGVTRGNHYHDTKIEKFCVIQGQGIIRFRNLYSDVILEYPVGGEVVNVVDVPPGYTHSIENNGEEVMICLFWADQVFDLDVPDTFWEKVL